MAAQTETRPECPGHELSPACCVGRTVRASVDQRLHPAFNFNDLHRLAISIKKLNSRLTFILHHHMAGWIIRNGGLDDEIDQDLKRQSLDLILSQGNALKGSSRF